MSAEVQNEYEDVEEEEGAECPFCGTCNTIPHGSCSHYVGYYNVAECEWEFDGVMTEWNTVNSDVRLFTRG